MIINLFKFISRSLHPNLTTGSRMLPPATYRFLSVAATPAEKELQDQQDGRPTTLNTRSSTFRSHSTQREPSYINEADQLEKILHSVNLNVQVRSFIQS